jgi:hypothetical protein
MGPLIVCLVLSLPCLITIPLYISWMALAKKDLVSNELRDFLYNGPSFLILLPVFCLIAVIVLLIWSIVRLCMKINCDINVNNWFLILIRQFNKFMGLSNE